MTTVQDILRFIETIAPPEMAEDWDHVGLNCGHLSQPVTKILVALDPFGAACREAKEIGAQLLVTHHGLLFHPGFITDETETGRNTLFLIENGIAHINAHTNLDQAPGGVNDCLAAKLGLTDIQVVNPKGTDAQGRPWGLLRCGFVPEQPLSQFLSTVKTALNCEGLRYADCGKPVYRVAVGGGSCASEMEEAIASGCDTFVTADVKYNQFWDAQAMGLTLIDAGHFCTENPVVSYLAGALSVQFPDVTVKISEKHQDCMKFY